MDPVTGLAGPAGALQLWGGPECTVNRIGDVFRDQTVLTGHHDRPEDLDRLAALGIRKLRYPVLWERVAPEHPDRHDWRWSDERLGRIRDLGMSAIVGLLHHGSGPAYTSLVDDAFPVLLGRYAQAVAERYPDTVDWTPVNEPLTTARFSALYGHWYPHGYDDRLFWAVVLNQIDGTRAAMRAIRAVNADARLIQTEDLGYCHATDGTIAVADHYNQRRWMTWDLLAGRVNRDHPFWEPLDTLGFGDRLRAIADDPCPADVIGIDHYVASDRFLDDRAGVHAAPFPAEGYHDVAAIRVLDPAPHGLAGVIRAAWDRYGTTIAVTESHLSCTREEQLRWLDQSWRDCLGLRQEGIDVQAMTAWALFGAFDWDSVLTRPVDHYEVGAFDIRSGTPRPTAIASLLATLGGRSAPSPAVAAVLHDRGWWQRPLRFEHARHAWDGEGPAPVTLAPGPPLLITGATGTLGQALAAMCVMRGLTHVLTDRSELPLDRPDAMAAALDRHRPWAVVNAAGWTRVDDAEREPDACHMANTVGAANLARACAERGIHCTLFSQDLVFDGAQGPYDEAGRPAPLGVYGRSKAQAEQLAREAGGAMLIVRTAALFSAEDPRNFAAAVERALRTGRSIAASPHHIVSPTYVPDLVQATLDLVVDGATGIVHLTNGEAVSWIQFARRIATALGQDDRLVVAGDGDTLGWRAPRPANAALVSRHGRMLPSLENAIGRFAAVRRSHRPPLTQVERAA